MLSFVQDFNKLNDVYVRFPIEILVDEIGDCEDMSVLLANIIAYMNAKTALIGLPDFDHVVAGIGITQSVIDNWDENKMGYPITYYKLDNDNLYAYCETTLIGFRVGELPYYELLDVNTTGDYTNIIGLPINLIGALNIGL